VVPLSEELDQHLTAPIGVETPRRLISQTAVKPGISGMSAPRC
jgi:hypothetical protein